MSSPVAAGQLFAYTVILHCTRLGDSAWASPAGLYVLSKAPQAMALKLSKRETHIHHWTDSVINQSLEFATRWLTGSTAAQPTTKREAALN